MSDMKDEVRTFYAALGKAITQWAQVEEALFNIFQRGLRLRDSEEAAAAFYSQINFRAKLDMVDAVLAVRLPTKEQRADWARLSSRLRKRSKKRNALAHFYMVYQAKKGDGPVLQLTPTLKPNPGQPSNRLSFIYGDQDIDTVGIRSISEQFAVITRDLEAFLTREL